MANTGAVAAARLDLQPDRIIPRKQVFSWALWDWATQPFNSVILTFVFTALYLTTDTFIDPAIAALGEGNKTYELALSDLSAQFGLAIFIAGLLIAVLAPVMGQRSDAAGKRKFWLAINTGILVVCMLLLFFVQAAPAYFVLGISLIAVASVFSEIAGVNYNAMLVQVSTKATVGKVSGLGWGFGYLGGIVALIIVVIVTKLDWFGMPLENGMAFRVIAVGCAIWTVLFAIPIFLNVPEVEASARRERVGFLGSYVVLVKDVARLYRESSQTFWFLLASAIFRDGLAGVFAFGAIIAAVTFKFTSDEVLIFGIAANLVAGLSTIIAGRFDDIFGPRAVILFALTGLVVAGTVTFFMHDSSKIVFWICGLILCIFVGPAQAASRSLLARVTPAGREGEIFGLYATTGRAASFLSPGLWTLFIAIFGFQYWGILGIVAVLALGLVLMLFVKAGGRNSAGVAPAPALTPPSKRIESESAPAASAPKPRRLTFSGATLLILGATSTISQLIAVQIFAPGWTLAAGQSVWSTGGVVALVASIYMWATCRTWTDFKRRIGVLVAITAVFAVVAAYLVTVSR